MFFEITNFLDEPIDEKKTEIIEIAYSRILQYPLSVAKLVLDQYLQTKYKKGLKSLCQELVLKKTTVNSGAEDDKLIVTFKDQESDDLAKLITYGNEEVQGCDILKFAFDQQY